MSPEMSSHILWIPDTSIIVFFSLAEEVMIAGNFSCWWETINFLSAIVCRFSLVASLSEKFISAQHQSQALVTGIVPLSPAESTDSLLANPFIIVEWLLAAFEAHDAFGMSQSLHLVSVQGNISRFTEKGAAMLLGFRELMNKHYAWVRMLLALRNQNNFVGHFFIHLYTNGLHYCTSQLEVLYFTEITLPMLCNSNMCL